MPETQVTRTVSKQQLGGADVQQEQIVTSDNSDEMDPHEFTIGKASQFIWFLTHFIAIILTLRFVFLILGARITGVVAFIYNISNIFVLPFRGIFPSPTTGQSYFDTAALLGVAMYYLLAFLIIQVLMLFSKKTDPEV